MIKVIAATLIVIMCLHSAVAQKISEKDAKQFLTKAWNYVRTNDTASFINLWSLNDSLSKNQQRPHTRQRVLGNFNMVKEWLDTALQRNQNIDYFLVDKQSLEGTDTKYWIQAWFKYDKNYEKGFGFYMAYINNKWVVRDNPSTSYLRRPQ